MIKTDKAVEDFIHGSDGGEQFKEYIQGLSKKQLLECLEYLVEDYGQQIQNVIKYHNIYG